MYKQCIYTRKKEMSIAKWRRNHIYYDQKTVRCSDMSESRFLKALKKEIRLNIGLYVLALVPFVYLIIFRYWPMYGVQIAFRDYKVGEGTAAIVNSEWVGLKHISRYFVSPMFWPTIRNTLIINIYGIITFPLPLVLAVLLNYLPSQSYKKAIQMISYAPHFISTVVMVGMILQFLDKNNGLVNRILGIVGVGPYNFMADAGAFYHIYQWSGVWQGLGYASIIYIASLASVPPELHEAATIDGATMVKRIWHVDIPSILPTICILLILQCGRLLGVGYEKVYLMQNNLNEKVSEVISTYVYKQGLRASTPQYSYSTAISLFTSLVNAVMLLTVNRISRSLSGNGLW